MLGDDRNVFVWITVSEQMALACGGRETSRVIAKDPLTSV